MWRSYVCNIIKIKLFILIMILDTNSKISILPSLMASIRKIISIVFPQDEKETEENLSGIARKLYFYLIS